MKRKNSYSKKKNKKPGRGLTITLLVSAVSMTGLLTWLVMNDWDVEKSMENAQKAIGMSVPADDEKVASENGVLKKEDEKGKQQEEITNQKSTEQTTAPTKTTQSDGTRNTKTVTTTKSASSIDSGGYIKGQVLPKEPKFVNGILLANKKYPLPETYAPGEDKTARAAFETMAAEAKLADFNLYAFSTYRAFEYQSTLYERYVARDGEKAADTYSARPGYSEHQTGLAFDIGEVNFEQHFASSSFGETEAGKWVAANAHRFGFIMRYPEGKEQITGYMHESWHFRYVGKEIAGEIFKRNITLEEYLGVH